MRQFVIDNHHTITEERKEDVKALLLERISLRGISRSMTVSTTWLMEFAVKTWRETPDHLGVPDEITSRIDPKELQLLHLQADEMWSFVRKKECKHWIWVVYCPVYRQVLAYHIGGRSKVDAQLLFDKLPIAFKHNCQFQTDYWEAYNATINKKQLTQSKALTYFIEGYFTGVRARVSRLVRRSLAFSKKVENHILAIGYFFWHRNLGSYPYI